MQRVFVLDSTQKPLMPCHGARARELLSNGKAQVYQQFPFTIILLQTAGGVTQETELKVDPGSKVTGMGIVAKYKNGKKLLWATNLQHRGEQIKKALDTRRALRRSRRSRKTRYRKSRFSNRVRKKDWFPPSLHSRVHNVLSWGKRLLKRIPLASLAVETVRFDLQKLQNPEISGIQYNQGTLFSYEIREYLLEKWGRKCAYCSKEDIPLEIDHVVPKSRGGSNRVSNLAIACRTCNEKKGNKPIKEFLKTTKTLLKIQEQLKKPLKDTAAVNTTRIAIGKVLSTLSLPITFWSGGLTKYNRTSQNYLKDYWIDAACVGESGRQVWIDPFASPLFIQENGRGKRQFCRMDKFGFPRTRAKKKKFSLGFKTGDIVKAIVTKGKKTGIYFGRVLVRSSGYFCIQTATKKIDGISYKYCQRLQQADGYSFQTNLNGGSVSSLPFWAEFPRLKHDEKSKQKRR